MKLTLIMLSCVLLSGCATLTPGGSKVRETYNTDLVKNCKFIKQVEASTALSGTGDIAGQESLIVKLRNLTAEAGGDTVYVEKSSHGYAGQKALGSAYNCAASSPVK